MGQEKNRLGVYITGTIVCTVMDIHCCHWIFYIKADAGTGSLLQ